VSEAQKISKRVEKRGRAEVEKKAQALERLKVEYVPIDSVKPNSYNPNRQNDRDFQLLLRSMREDGFTQPVVVQKSTREIVDGEHRWRAARELGMTEIPVVFVEMSAEQMRIATLRHNRARGSEDIELSSQLLRDLRELGALEWAADSLMLDDKTLDRLLSDVPVPEILASEEYSEAWQPTRNPTADEDIKPRPDERTDMSSSFKEQAEKTRAKMQATGDLGKKAQFEMDLRKKTYKVVAVFKDEDAEIVRRALEPKPADRLLALCRARVEKMKAAAQA